jgi:hypothetical protein
MELGKMDFVVPMVYWEMDHKTHPFGPLVTEWTSRVAYDRQVFSGILMGLEQKFGWHEVAAEVEAARHRGAVGVVFFGAASLEKSWQTLGGEEFPYWSNVPRMAWKDSIAPHAPKLDPPAFAAGRMKIAWNEVPESDGAACWDVYRSSSAMIDTKDVKNLLCVTPRNTREFADSTVDGKKWYYAVTALDRAGNESEPSNVVSTELPIASGTARNSTQ